jgi:hypothetical protein
MAKATGSNVIVLLTRYDYSKGGVLLLDELHDCGSKQLFSWKTEANIFWIDKCYLQ